MPARPVPAALAQTCVELWPQKAEEVPAPVWWRLAERGIATAPALGIASGEAGLLLFLCGWGLADDPLFPRPEGCIWSALDRIFA